MARKRHHEDHVNHEAWAIPYGDLLTLLLAFFVVMYAISSINEGKYRVLSDALSVAFSGKPHTIKPIQLGDVVQREENNPSHISLVVPNPPEQSVGGTLRDLKNPAVIPNPHAQDIATQQLHAAGNTGYQNEQIRRLSEEVKNALGDLVARNLVSVHAKGLTLEIEMNTDILFPSGSADIATSAKAVLGHLADVLKSIPNPMRIEGHTDNVPIHTAMFPSNWELSAARAASVVHLFMDQGVNPHRMAVAGFAEYRPTGENDSTEGRNHNRRVVIVILADARGEAAGDEVGDPAAAADAAVTAADGGGTETTTSTDPAATPASPTPEQ